MSGRRFANAEIREEVRVGPVKGVDLDKAVVYGVKILGLQSANRRRYTESAIKKARGLYEGRVVNLDHPTQPDRTRACDERFGWLSNVREETDGLYGDLNYLQRHPMGPAFAEAAQRNPNLFGLSHNARGGGHLDDQGIEIIEEITDVVSVDLVTDPATTGGLLEQRIPMKKVKIKAFLEGIMSRFDQVKRAAVKKLIEDGLAKPEAEIEEPPVETSPEDAMKTAFASAGHAAINAVIAGELEAGEALKKIKELFAAHFKFNGGATEEGDDEEGDDEEDGEDGDGDKKVEHRIRRLERRELAYRLCEEAAITPEKVLIEAMVGVGSKAAMQRLIDREKSRSTPVPTRATPRSQSPGQVSVIQESKVPQKPTEVLDWLRG